MECDVEAALTLLMESVKVPEPERVKDLMGVEKPTQASLIAPLVVNLRAFDVVLDVLMVETV
jgi:hypothetical protein